jgi:hypothetical protein
MRGFFPFGKLRVRMTILSLVCKEIHSHSPVATTCALSHSAEVLCIFVIAARIIVSGSGQAVGTEFAMVPSASLALVLPEIILLPRPIALRPDWDKGDSQ